MLTTAVIAFREFLEAFLLIGVFFGISKKLNIKRESEIGFAAVCGFTISLILTSLLYFFGDYARSILTEERAELLESYLLIFSGCFLAYVVVSLHNIMQKGRGARLLTAHKKLQTNTFDVSLFVTIIMLVVREGFEIALFTASTSLFSVFFQNLLGLIVGFAAASVFGILAYFTYLKFSLGKIFKATEYLIVLLGASFVQNGITSLLKQSFNIHIDEMLRFPLQFIPQKETIVGHLLQSFVGIDREFSVMRLAVMICYIAAVYFFFYRKSFINTVK